MKNNPIQFAIVREDPQIESEIVKKTSLKNILLIGSGGCTAFHLKTIYPHLSITLIDPNAAQLDLIRRKQKLLMHTPFSLDEFDHLNECGNFESLFTQWRLFIHEFVTSPEEIHNIVFNKDTANKLFKNPYWKTSFQLFFSDPMLLTMFGSSAIQHAIQGSYPLYFQNIFEKGLLRQDRSSNYFLHHILFGKYDRCFLPLYLTTPLKSEIEYLIQTTAQNVTNFQNFDLISFSNIFDWMDPKDSTHILELLSQTMKKGSYFILRQLNNNKDYNLEGNFIKQQIDLNQDRSLFYNKITTYRKD